MDGHLVFGHVEGNVRGMKEVVGEELLDDIAFIAAADNEIVDTVLGIDFKDVPKDRSTADLNHRLRPQTSLFTNTCAETTGKDYGFHLLSNLILGRMLRTKSQLMLHAIPSNKAPAHSNKNSSILQALLDDGLADKQQPPAGILLH